MSPADKIGKTRIGDKKWSFGTRLIPGDRWGEANFDERSISLSTECPESKTLEVLVHEYLHAASHDVLSEEFVTQAGQELAKILKLAGVVKGRFV